METTRRGEPPAPPAEDATLDDWFADRLQSQGIPLRISSRNNARILALCGLLVALLGLLWAFSSAGSSDSSSSASSTATSSGTGAHSTGGTSHSGTFKHHVKVPAWNAIPVEVLNGYGGSGAAGSAGQTLTAEGWKVAGTANAGTTAIPSTIVVYGPGHGAEAAVVARKLGLPRPLPVTSVEGLAADATSGVAVVLGPNGLPA